MAHRANVLTGYTVNPDGQTQYQVLHGKRSSEQIVEFGERVFYLVPKKLRAKLSHRWRIGPYLGMATSPNEHVISTKQGNVVKVRYVCRVAEASRWSLKTVLGVIGTPTRLCPAGPEDIHAEIEHFEQPHSHVDEATADQVDDNTEEAKVLSKHIEAKITDKDLRLYGVSHNYPRCSGLQKGKRHPFRPHSVECRLRVYLSWKEHDNLRYKRIRHLLEPDAEKEENLGMLISMNFSMIGRILLLLSETLFH